MARILNVGCGQDTYGTDFIDLYPARSEVIPCDIEKGFPFADDTFDEVYSHCLFEHLRNPGAMLLEMKRVARPGGQVRVITDNGSYWAFAMERSAHTGAYESAETSDDRHFCFYTKHHLRNHFAEVGLKVERVEFLEYYSPGRLKRLACAVMQSLLKLTPLRNMAYARIDISGRK